MRFLNLFSTLGCCLLVSGCVSTNPATGQQQISLISEEREYDLGHEASAQLVEQYGLYKEHPALNTYLKKRLKDIVRVSERPDKPFSLRLLDSNDLNAAATPGFIMINRGLLALLNNEAQLMSVIGHEVGHVTARHTASAMTTATIANIGLLATNIFLQQKGIPGQSIDAFNQAGSVGAQLFFANYSRHHEQEADELGLRYIQRLGYNLYQPAEVFRAFKGSKSMSDRIRKTIDDKTEAPFYHRLLSTHPEDEARIESLSAQAAAKSARHGLLHRDRYFDAIDGMAFGPQLNDQGMAGHGIYRHPKFRFSFQLPDDYIFPRNAQLPDGIHLKAPVTLSLFAMPVNADMDAEEALILKMRKVQKIEPFTTKSGLTGYTGIMDVIKQKNTFHTEKTKNIRLFAFKGGEVNEEQYRGKSALYVMAFEVPVPMFHKYDRSFFAVAKTFRLMDKKEADKVQPLRLRIHTVKKGETQTSLAEKLPFNAWKLDWFQLLNGLGSHHRLLPGMRVKMIIDPNI